MKFSQFKTDKTLEVEGVWVKLDESSAIKVARMNNPKMQAFVRKRSRITRRGAGAPDIPDDVIIEGMSQFVLIDWEGMQDDTGTDLPYSNAAAYRVLKEISDFRSLVIDLSQNMETFRAEAIEEDTGN
jgi:hypothetical protein